MSVEELPDLLNAVRSLVRTTLVGGQEIFTHPPDQCMGQETNCCLHSPSRHHMRTWKQVYREGRMERICPHGIGHPDPDDLAWHRANGRDVATTHGCDGCCRPPSVPSRRKEAVAATKAKVSSRTDR